jgi:type II restriction enzyme
VAKREDLRKSRKGTIINVSSKKMESVLVKSLANTISLIEKEFEVRLSHEPRVYLGEIVAHLSSNFPDIDFAFHFNSSFLLPDGGILYLLDKKNQKHVLLISEAKRQGTNDLREAEGLKKQAQGNAIERLGKNVTGFRAWMASETIFPFVVFGQGVDFDSDSSILDRVSTIAMFAPLNKIELITQGDNIKFNRGSFFFRKEPWKVNEMSEIMFEITKRSIYYYFAKYGQNSFVGK